MRVRVRVFHFLWFFWEPVVQVVFGNLNHVDYCGATLVGTMLQEFDCK